MNTLQQEIIRELEVRPTIDPEQEFEQRSDFLAGYLATSGMRGFVIALSGGQDSMLAGKLTKNAVERSRGRGHPATVHAVLLPYGEQRDRDDALLACEVVKPDVVHDLNIKAATDSLAETYGQAEQRRLSDFAKGNVKARMRMIAQYAIAGEHDLLVVGTDHAAEAVTGFFTKYGDGGADVLPLSGLTKRQGKQILRTLGVPDVFTEKKPTADLLDGNPGQADEQELGMKYTDIDDYLEGKTVDPEVAEAIEKRFKQTIHKRTVPVAYTPNA